MPRSVIPYDPEGWKKPMFPDPGFPKTSPSAPPSSKLSPERQAERDELAGRRDRPAGAFSPKMKDPKTGEMVTRDLTKTPGTAASMVANPEVYQRLMGEEDLDKAKGAFLNFLRLGIGKGGMTIGRYNWYAMTVQRIPDVDDLRHLITSFVVANSEAGRVLRVGSESKELPEELVLLAEFLSLERGAALLIEARDHPLKGYLSYDASQFPDQAADWTDEDLSRFNQVIEQNMEKSYPGPADYKQKLREQYLNDARQYVEQAREDKGRAAELGVVHGGDQDVRIQDIAEKWAQYMQASDRPTYETMQESGSEDEVWFELPNNIELTKADAEPLKTYLTSQDSDLREEVYKAFRQLGDADVRDFVLEIVPPRTAIFALQR